MNTNRYQASLVHLVLSILVFSSLVAVMYFHWYPGKLFFMDGGWQGLKLVAMVDLVLGPALTLVVFNTAKPSLKFDLALIAALQISALAYGFYATYQQRPVAIVYADGRFNTLSHNDYKAASAQLRNKAVEPVPLHHFGQGTPVLAYTEPHDGESFARYLESVLNDYPEQRERSDQYLTIDAGRDRLFELQKDPAELPVPDLQQRLDRLGKQHEVPAEQLAVFSFRARYASGYTILNMRDGELVDFIDKAGLPAAAKDDIQQVENQQEEAR